MPRNLIFGLVAALAAALGLATSLMLARPKAIQLVNGTLLEAPRAIPDFTLSDGDGKPLTRASLLGHYSLFFVGFTTCPDVCPTTLTTLKAVLKKLGPDTEQLQIVFLSIDPERDTPARLKQYLSFFDPRIIGATGSNAELDKLALAMSFVYAKVPGATAETYTMDHSAALILIDPQAQVRAFFTPPHKAEVLAADLKTLLGNKS